MTVDRASMIKTPILLFALYGFWCPLWWSAKWKLAYNFYTVLASVILIIGMITQSFSIIFNINDLSGLALNCISLMPTIDACTKATNILVHRQKIVSLLHMFEQEKCKVRDYREKRLQQKYEKLFTIANMTTIILAFSTVGFMLTSPFLRDSNSRQLPFMSWVPYGVDNELSFWCTYVIEIVMAPFMILVDMANVLFTISLMGQISLQLDLLNYRILRIADNNFDIVDSYYERRKKLVDCVNHHLLIFELAEATQRCFVATFFVQMLVSIVGICMGAHLLARSGIQSADTHSTIFFLACMIVLGFPCCWIGNVVYLKSLDVSRAVYETNWTELEPDFRKDLLNICLRAKRPIMFTCGPAITLSNRAFMRILQASYTTFTVLQRVTYRDSNRNG